MAKRVGQNHGIRYSESFKMGVVRELEEQDLPFAQVRRKYGNGNRGKRIRVEKPEEINELERLRRRVRLLEKSLADANIDLALERAYTELACERVGVDAQEFKKKAAGQLRTKL